MRTLIAICFWAFGFSLEASAAKKVETAIECEFLLTNPEDASAIIKWISHAVSPMEGPEQVFLGNFPKAAAFRELNLPQPFPRKAQMVVEASPLERELYWVRILNKDGSEAARFPFHLPPVAVWKHVASWGNQREVELELDMREDAKVISAGTLLGDFAGGRKFVVIRRRMASLVTVAIGVDVEMDRFRTYTNAAEPTVVAIEENKLWARVEVIKAHFTIPSVRETEQRLQ